MYKLEDFNIEESVSAKLKFPNGTEADANHWFKDSYYDFMSFYEATKAVTTIFYE